MESRASGKTCRRRWLAHVALLAGFAVGGSALAQGISPHATRVAEFTRQLADAKTARVQFSRISTCLGDRETRLGQQRDALQTELAPLMTQQRELGVQVTARTTAVSERTATLTEAQDKAASIEHEIATLPNRARYEKYEQLCNIPYVNAWDRRYCTHNDVLHGNALARARANLQAAGKRRADALLALGEARERLDTSERELAATNSAVITTQARIDVIVPQIVAVKSARAQALLVEQPMSKAINRLDGEMRNVGNLDLSDDQPGALSELEDASAFLGNTVAAGRSAVNGIEQALGANWVATCLAPM